MKKFRSRTLTVFLFALPFAILLRIWFQREGLAKIALLRVARGTSIAEQVRGRSHGTAVKLWHALPYSALSKSDSFWREWSQLRAKFQTNITPEQHRQLLKDALLILLMNASGQTANIYRGYVSARQPTCVIPDSELRQWARELGMEAHSEPVEIAAAVIRSFVKKPQLRAVCIPASAVTYESFSSSKAPYAPITKGSVFGNAEKVGTTHRMFAFADEFSEHYSRGEPVNVAEMILYLRVHDVDAGPFILRMWWCAGASEWRPLELVSGTDSSKTICFLP